MSFLPGYRIDRKAGRAVKIQPQAAPRSAQAPRGGKQSAKTSSLSSEVLRASTGRIGVHLFEDWGEQWVQYYLPEPPSANRWWRNVQGRMVLSREARAYKQSIQNAALLVKCPKVPAPEPVRLRIVWHRGRKAGDLDKRIGIALDALQGVAYDNDSQIVGIHAERQECDALGPRLIVLMRVA